jgi:hypothetical protein
MYIYLGRYLPKVITMPTRFLPPDFTFTSEGPIKLGTALAHPTRPTLVLASLPANSSITLPKESTVVEPNHSHKNSASPSASVNIWAKFLDVATASAKTEAGGINFESYGIADHEIRSFANPFTRSTATAITTLPDVKKHIDTGIFGKKLVYIVTGLRIAKKSFMVKKEAASNLSEEISGSRPPEAPFLSGLVLVLVVLPSERLRTPTTRFRKLFLPIVFLSLERRERVSR